MGEITIRQPKKVRNLDLVRLDDAWSELARIDEQQMRLVELRFFGALP